MKITIQLDSDQMELLFDLVKARAAEDARFSHIYKVVFNAIQLDTLVDHKVTMLLAHLTGIAHDRIHNEHTLSTHLGIGTNKKRFLAAPFQEIARGFKQGVRITQEETKGLETVQKCIDLIKSKIQ